MREQRIKQFKELQEHILLLDCEIKKAECIDIKDYKNKTISNTTHSITFHNEQVTRTILRYDNPLTLVFGSAKNPGGGVLRGSRAQEEDIALTSTWYFHVKDNKEFYNINHKDQTYSDKMLYVKDAYLLKDEFDCYIEPKKVSFIGGAAPNINGLTSSGKTINEKEIYTILKTRISGLFSFAELHNHKTLIVGAWGCGVFGLKPNEVAKVFKECIDEKLYSGKIVFAILDANQIELFKKVIK